VTQAVMRFESTTTISNNQYAGFLVETDPEGSGNYSGGI